MADKPITTTVGESIRISGNLQGDEDLTVFGRVDGTISLTSTLNVEESGVVKADIDVRNAVISGVVVGNITASDSVELTEAGRMVGDIRAPRVIIVEGARFRGAVDMGNLDAPRASGPMPARTVARPSTALAKSTHKPMTPSRPATPVRVADTKGKAPIAATPKATPIQPSKKIKKKVVIKKRKA